MRNTKLVVLIVLVLLGISTVVPAFRGREATLIAQTEPDYDSNIVRVYFDDLETARSVAITYEPLESNYDLGYLVLELTGDELRQLAESGLRVVPAQDLEERFERVEPPSQLVEIQSIPGYACYRTVEETYSSASSLAATYPTLATWTDVGDSWEKENGFGGYDIYVLKITNQAIPGPKPAVFVTSAIHAREYTTAELTTRFVEMLLADYGTDADATWLIDHHELHFMLQANPDGRKQAETGILWRKNTNQDYCSPTSNNRGADLNRNFPFGWNCCGGSSASQCSTTYHGAGPASEPETQAVTGYINNLFPDQRGPNINDAAPSNAEGLYLDIHSSGRLILWPWGFTSDPAPNGTQLQTLGRKLAYFNGHTPQQSIGLYPTDGTTTSFAYGEMGLAAFTYELGTEFFESCSYFENTLLQDNLPSLKYAMKTARAPYLLPAGPDISSIALSSGSDPVGVPSGTVVTLNVTADDTLFNNSNGSEPTQTVTAVEYYLDTAYWETGAVANTLSASDGNFNTGVEGATATIDTTGFANGQHILYVRAQDSLGNWGTVTAIFLYIDDNAPPPPTAVFFDDFESDLGWTTDPSGTDSATTGQWERANPQSTNSSGTKQLGTSFSGVNNLVTGPLAGTSVGTHDIDNGVTSVRSPNIALPANGDLNLSFAYYLSHLNNAGTDDFLRVTVIGSSSTVVYEELGAANDDDAVWDTFSTSLNSFAGDTVYLLIEAADAGTPSLIEAGVDDVLITVSGSTAPTPTAVPPTNTPAPPTNTPIPPTNTPIPPPTDTPPPPTDTPIPPPTNTPLPPTDTPIPPTNTPIPPPTNTPVPGTDDVIYVSSTSGGTAGAVSYSDEDILAFDTGSGQWTKYFDGSDVGLSGSSARDVDAFHLLGDGSILLSIISASTIPDVGSIDDSDIVRFVPTSTGEATSGTFEMYFDASDVGLTTNGEDVDAIYIAANGDLIISTSGSFSVSGASGADEDLLRFTPTALGTTTSGSFALYFDGSDVGLNSSSSEDVSGAWVDEANSEIQFSTRGSFGVSGLSGTDEDIASCNAATTGTSTSCGSFSLVWDGSANGFGTEDVDGLFVERP